MASEKRTSARQPFSTEIEFEAMVPGTKRSGTEHRAGCLDISQGGLGLATRFRPQEGAVLKLSIPFQGDVKLPVFAEVMWIKDEADGFRAGMRFLS